MPDEYKTAAIAAAKINSLIDGAADGCAAELLALILHAVVECLGELRQINAHLEPPTWSQRDTRGPGDVADEYADTWRCRDDA